MPIIHTEQKLAIGLSLGILTVLFATTVNAMAKYLAITVDISAIIFFQYLICITCTLPWLLKHGVGALKTSHLKLHLLRGISGCVGFYALYCALHAIPLVDATLLRTTAPLLVPVVIFFGLNIHIPKSRWLSLIVGFIGIVVVLKPGQQGLSLWHLIGLGSGLCLAISMVSTRLLVSTEPAGRVLFYYFFISLLVATPFFLLNYHPVPPQAMAGLAFVGIFMYLAFALYTRALTYTKASILAPTSYFSVIFSGVLDWMFWGHIPDIWTYAGTVLIVFGGLLLLRQGAN